MEHGERYQFQTLAWPDTGGKKILGKFTHPLQHTGDMEVKRLDWDTLLTAMVPSTCPQGAAWSTFTASPASHRTLNLLSGRAGMGPGRLSAPLSRSRCSSEEPRVVPRGWSDVAAALPATRSPKLPAAREGGREGRRLRRGSLPNPSPATDTPWASAHPSPVTCWVIPWGRGRVRKGGEKSPLVATGSPAYR